MRAHVCLFALSIALSSTACESPDNASTDGAPKKQKTVGEPAGEKTEPAAAESELSLEQRQALWRCAVQRADVAQAKDLEISVEPATKAIRDALRTAETEEERSERLKRNWNIEWDPSAITDWSVGWDHRGLRVRGRADEARDVAELARRLETTGSIPDVSIDLVESVGDGNERVVHFVLSERLVSDAAKLGELDTILEEAAKTGFDQTTDEYCELATSGEPEPPAEGFAGASWAPIEPRVGTLHRVHSWRATVAEDALAKVVDAAGEFDGLEVSPGASSVEVIVSRLDPLEAPDFAPHAVPDPTAETPRGPWAAQLQCEQPLCGVEIDDPMVRARVEKMVELVEKADRLQRFQDLLAEFETPKVVQSTVFECLRKQSPVARADDEATTAEDHAAAQADKPIRIRSLAFAEGVFELQYETIDKAEDGDLAATLESCIDGNEAVDSASVNADESAETLEIEVATTASADAPEPPPWNPNGSNTGRQIIEDFAGAQGEKFKQRLLDRVVQQQRNLLIAREVIPFSVEEAALIQRLDNQVRTAGGQLEEVDYLYAVRVGRSSVSANRFRVVVSASPESALSALYYFSQMTRVFAPIVVEYDAESARLTGEFEAYSYNDER